LDISEFDKSEYDKSTFEKFALLFLSVKITLKAYHTISIFIPYREFDAFCTVFSVSNI
jgi:hypothetical protein